MALAPVRAGIIDLSAGILEKIRLDQIVTLFAGPDRIALGLQDIDSGRRQKRGYQLDDLARLYVPCRLENDRQGHPVLVFNLVLIQRE